MKQFIRGAGLAIGAVARVARAVPALMALLVVVGIGLSSFVAMGCAKDQHGAVMAAVDRAYSITGKIEYQLGQCSIGSAHPEACDIGKSGMQDLRAALQDAKNPGTASEPPKQE